MDVMVNQAAKEFLRTKFCECKQIDKGDDLNTVDLRLNVVKPLGARWTIQLYDYLKLNPKIIKNGCNGAGINYC